MHPLACKLTHMHAISQTHRVDGWLYRTNLLPLASNATVGYRESSLELIRDGVLCPGLPSSPGEEHASNVKPRRRRVCTFYFSFINMI